MFKTADDIQAFTDTLIHIAEKCIPKSSTRSKRNRPWFNNDIKNSINKRKSALRKLNRQPTKESLIHAKQMRANARKTTRGPRFAHLSDIATVDMQMLCNIFPILSSQLIKISSFEQFLVLKKNIWA